MSKLHSRNPQWKQVNAEIVAYEAVLLDPRSTPAEASFAKEALTGLRISREIIEKGLKQFLIAKTRPDAVIPQYATDGASGFDFVALEDYVLKPVGCVDTVAVNEARNNGGKLPDFTTVDLNRAFIPLGLAFAIPQGFELQIRGRSGLAKKGVAITHGVGTVDSDYRGEIAVMLINHSNDTIFINKGDRIAQGIYCPVTVIEHKEVSLEELGKTARGAGGFGHTGK
jgi:dUTP pyrophosphatase